MGRINMGRVILGGLVAGLVWTVGEFILNVPILGDEWEAAYAALGFPEDPALSGVVWYVVFTLIAGILAVWTYAAMRPRFGPGPMTAIKAGLLLWAVSYGNFWVFSEVTGLFPKELGRITLIWAFFEVPIATMAGAWLYREEPAAATPTVQPRA